MNATTPPDAVASRVLKDAIALRSVMGSDIQELHETKWLYLADQGIQGLANGRRQTGN